MTDDKPKKVGRLHKTNDSTIVEALRPLAVSIDSLHHDAANARRHGERNLDAIRASLAQFGQRKPIVVQRDGMIVRAGNGTLEAARALGWTEIAAVVIDEDGTTAAQFAIADNRTAELAEWDQETLATLLQSWDEDTREALGFSTQEMNDMLLDIGDLPDDLKEDPVPEAPEEPTTKPGDLWVLGNHRLLCGDSTKPEDMARLMDGERANLLITDPPYNVDYEGGTGLKIQNDAMPEEVFQQFLVDALGACFANMEPGSGWYIWHPGGEPAGSFRAALRLLGQQVRQQLIWVKSSLVLGRQDYQWRHEPCLYGWTDGAAHKFYGDRTETTVLEPDSQEPKPEPGVLVAKTTNGKKVVVRTTVLEVDKPSRSKEHPTMKPVLLFAPLMNNSTRKQELVLDPFLGSGTSLIVAEHLQRRCFGMELDPRYCDVIVERWQRLTGKKAQLQKPASHEQERQD